MNIQQIRYFSVVYETLNFVHAADRLYISRQGLRSAIRSLESEIGQKLFVNDANRLKATKAAEKLYAASRPVLQSFSELEKCVIEMKSEDIERIRLGRSRGAFEIFSKSEQSVNLHVTPEDILIASKLFIREGSCKEVREWVLSGETDYAGLIATDVDERLFDYEVMCEGRIYLAVNREHPLAGRETVTVTDLRDVPICSQGPGFDVYDVVAAEAQRRGFELNLVSILSDVYSCLPYVESGMCVTLVYAQTVFPRFAPSVVCIPFEEPDFHWMYCSLAKKGMGDPYWLRSFAGKGTRLLS
jgi:DNA-binding transcriptional LysR family regulator